MSLVNWDVISWRQFREKDLTSEWGWLTLVGLFWLEQGTNSIGSDASSCIVLPKESSLVGSIELEGHNVFLTPADGADFRIGATHINQKTPLKTDESGAPTDVRIGDYSLTVIKRSGQLAVRLRDKNSPLRTDFRGLRYFPDNEDLRFVARFHPHDAPIVYRASTAIGREEDETFAGYLEFDRNGKQYHLEAQTHKANQLFVTFRDTTSGKTSYGACRFLLTTLSDDGTVNLDFNQAYNPPCSFTPWATCSLPHPNNRLDFPVEAGELAP